jgi:hypothetical protein
MMVTLCTLLLAKTKMISRMMVTLCPLLLTMISQMISQIPSTFCTLFLGHL